MDDIKLSKKDPRNIILKDIYENLLSNEIQYVCLGNPYYLEKDFSGDIDLLVAIDDIKKTYLLIRKILKSKNLNYLERKYISINRFEKLKFFIDPFWEENNPCLQIDIIQSIYNKGLTFLEYDDISKFCLKKREIKILDFKIRNYLGIFKDLIYCQRIKDSRKIESHEIENFILFLEEFGYSSFLLKTLFNNYEKKYLRFVFLLIIYLDNLSLKKIYQFIYFFLNLLKIIYSGYFKNKLVVFYGPDGSGKSTIINNIFEREIFKKYFDSIIIKHTKPGFLPPLSRYKFDKLQNKKIFKPRSTIPQKQFKVLIHFFYYGLDYFIENIYLSLKCIFPKKILIVYDRHIYEMAYQQTYSKLPKSFLYLFNKISYKPIINFFIYGDSKVIYKRKQELSVNEIDYQINKFLVIDKKYSLMSKKINNSQAITISLENTFKNLINTLKNIP